MRKMNEEIELFYDGYKLFEQNRFIETIEYFSLFYCHSYELQIKITKIID